MRALAQTFAMIDSVKLGYVYDCSLFWGHCAQSMCVLRNVLGASLFTQAPLHIFAKEQSGVGKQRRSKGQGEALKLKRWCRNTPFGACVSVSVLWRPPIILFDAFTPPSANRWFQMRVRSPVARWHCSPVCSLSRFPTHISVCVNVLHTLGIVVANVNEDY